MHSRVDPVTARATPLTSQPDMDVEDLVAVPVAGGFWFTGRERGGEHRPAVAVSGDRGRTWAVHVFGRGEADFPASSEFAFAVPASADGVTGYTVISVPDPASAAGGGMNTVVYRTGDGAATWQRVPTRQALPRGYYEGGDAYVAAGGTHVVLTGEDPPLQWSASTDGGQTYHAADLPGLGRSLRFSLGFHRVVTAAPGVYLAYDDEALFRSADGIRWTRTVIRPS